MNHATQSNQRRRWQAMSALFALALATGCAQTGGGAKPDAAAAPAPAATAAKPVAAAAPDLVPEKRTP